MLGLGLLSCAAGMFLPWVWRTSHYSSLRWAYHRNIFLDRVLRELSHRLAVDHPQPWWAPEEWWWCLPLIYGLAAPALWCWSARKDLRLRLCAAWLWWLGVLTTMACFALMPALQTSVKHPWNLDSGFFLSAVGAAMIALPSMVDLHLCLRRTTRWARRSGASQACERDPEAQRRPLPAPLRHPVHDASMLWAELGPHEPLDGEQSRLLAELIGDLRRLGPSERSWLAERGASPEALVETLAPDPTDRESWFEENLRLDRGLAHLVTATWREPATSPYR